MSLGPTSPALLLDQVDAAVIAVDSAGKVVRWNARAEQWFGHTSADALGSDLLSLDGPDHPGGGEVAALMLHVAGGRAWRGELAVRTPDGRAFPAHASVTPLSSDGALCLCVDLTTSRADEVERRLDERLFRAVFDQALDAILIAGDDRRWVDANPSACTLLGLPRHELLARGVDDLTPDDDDAVEREWQRLLGAGSDTGELELLRPDGTIVPVEFSATANFLPGRHAWVLRDISDRRHLEAQLRQSQKLEGIGRLAGGVAHDFNNLLAVILNYADFVAQGLEGSDPRLLEDVEEIRRAAERATELTQQLLVLSRRDVAQPQTLDLNAVLTDTERLLTRTLGEDVRLETRFAPDLHATRADRGQIEQVILNLAVNARDAMREGGGTLLIATENAEVDTAYARAHPDANPGSYVRLAVHDTGCGMAPDVAAQAFEPFFTTKPEGEGSGLGLASVYGIARQWGGHVDLHSEPGVGTSVKVYLPTTAEPVPVDGDDPQHEQPRGRGQRVLVVEDEDGVRRLTVRILSEAGYEVLEAGDARSALDLDTDGVELLVTDVVMPGMSGKDLAEELRERHPGLRTLFMSGYTDDVVMRHGILEARLAFIEKPFTGGTLLRKVRDRLAAREAV